MFAARLHDDTPEDFTRYEAAALIPKSNPFLKQLFTHIASGLEDELVWIVDDLVTMFGASDIRKIMKDYGKSTSQGDPMIHFYEDFLAAYDSGLRKDRGVWYTPHPVVKFIVRAVDFILEKSFGLPDGLATRDKVEIEVEEDSTYGKKSTKKVKRLVHKVQMLDPATGTGTFLAECVNRIYAKFAGHTGKWKSYVKEDLLPRLNGFEVLMASCTVAHVKLDMVLANTGYTHTGDGRFNIFLTNSLEEHIESMGPLFAAALGEEANAAKFIKRDCPVMVVMGNPPYSGESQNKGAWIAKLMEDYKKEPGGKEKLKERNPKWLNDDYVKFIRYAQQFIERRGEGIVAYINPHGYLDNPTFRGMRWNLLKTFDDIYVVNLHGNAKKKETAPDGSKDENVFNIMQGVSINIFVKKGNYGQDLQRGRACKSCSESLARRIIGNLDYVVRNRLKDDIKFPSCYDSRQLPLYREWAWEEEKRRMVEVALVAEAYKDDDDDDDLPDNALGAEHIALAEAELVENGKVELIEEMNFENEEGCNGAR